MITKFHNTGYGIKNYISRYHGCTKVEVLNSAWYVLPRGKDICTSLRNSQKLQTAYVKVRGEGKSMEHSSNCKYVSKDKAQGLRESNKR